MCHGADCPAWDADEAADLRAGSDRGLNERMPAVPSRRATGRDKGSRKQKTMSGHVSLSVVRVSRGGTCTVTYLYLRAVHRL